MNKVEPKTLPGFMELLPQEQILFNQIYDKIKNVYESFGFLPIDTPVLEYSDVLLAKAGGETEKQIYRFTKGSNDLSMRFDHTVPLARYVAEHFNDLTFPFKRYAMNKVYRGERNQKGRYREFYQCDIDIIGNGSLDIVYDAELPAIIYKIFSELNFGDFIIKINNRKILNGFFESIDQEDKITEILRVIDKIDKIGKDAVRDELIKCDVTYDSAERILKFIAINGTNDEIFEQLDNFKVDSTMYKEGVYELKQVVDYLRGFNIPEKSFNISLAIARGLDYYTGTVYETNLVKYPELGSVCSGGRYDNLTSYYSSQNMPGVGISIGLTRLFSQLVEKNLIKSEEKSIAKIMITSVGTEDFKYVLKVANKFRDAGFKVDTYYGEKPLKNKMKYANKLAIPYVAIIGETEIETDQVTLKDMKTGEQILLSIDDAIELIK